MQLDIKSQQQMRQNSPSQNKFRPEIEGLRAVAALLVAVYHIWLGNVSGGVDVFFVVSGFLITGLLLRRLDQYNRIDILGYFQNLTKRLFPAAFFVLSMTTVACIIWLPKVRWDQTIVEIFASIFYYQNWQLAVNAVDYLAQNNEASPVQHFWAMSLQGQFYLIWPFLIIGSALLAKYVFKKSVRSTLTAILITVFSLSLAYSIYRTSFDQAWAYFDTFARVWEFSMGGLLAILISKISLSRSVSFILGWVGLIAIVSCGIVLQVSTVFPGYAALWPTLGAVFIIVAGSQGGTYGVHRILSSKPLVKMGSLSYAFYLWHWPMLIFYFIITGNESVSFLDGMMMLLFSLLLSYLTTHFVEKPIRSLKTVGTSVKRWAVVSACILPAVLLASGWSVSVHHYTVEVASSQVLNEDYPGAMALLSDHVTVPDDVPLQPLPVAARNDLPKMYEDGCHQTPRSSSVIECEYGITENPDYTIALVGGSHSAHWLPALEKVATAENIKILSYTKSGCRFSTMDLSSESCEEWNDRLMEILIEKQPDLVFTTADVGTQPTVPEGYVEKWEQLEAEGISVFAIRDTPWIGFDGPSCVEDNANNLMECVVEREKVLPSESAWSQLENPPANVHYADLSDAFCNEDYCPSVVGNVLVFRDKNHITTSYAKTLAPILRDEIMLALMQ